MKAEIIIIGGESYKLHFDMNTVCDMEEQGFNLFALETFGMSTVRKLLYFGLQAYQPHLTIKEVGLLFGAFLTEGGNAEELMEIISKALAKALPQNKEEAK